MNWKIKSRFDSINHKYIINIFKSQAVIEETKEKYIVCVIGVPDISIRMTCRLMMFGDIWNKISIEYAILSNQPVFTDCKVLKGFHGLLSEQIKRH